MAMELHRFFLDCHFLRDNVHIDCVQRSSNSSHRKITLYRMAPKSKPLSRIIIKLY